YFDPDRRRAGLPEDVAALVSALSESRVAVTLVNLSQTARRTVVVQGGGYGEHQLVSVRNGDTNVSIDGPLLTVQLEPGSGRRLELQMKRYTNAPTVKHPWQRSNW